MLNRLFGVLGYVPASSLRIVPEDAQQPAVEPPALHRLSIREFDYGRASADAQCHWHSDGGNFHYALGRDDWVPLAVAGFCLTSSRQCLAWLDESLRLRTGVSQDVIDGWRRANQPVLQAYGSRLDQRVSFPSRQQDTGIVEMDTVPFIAVTEMAELFALAWQRAHLNSPFVFLGNSAPYVALGGHHVLRAVRDANEYALERTLEWLALWLEARGLTVDRRRHVVHMPGYQALYYRGSAEMWD